MMQEEERIVENLKSQKPQVKPDESFKLSLFQNLQNEMKKKASSTPHKINFNFMQKLKFAIPAAALVLVAILAVVSYPQYSDNQKVSLTGDQQIIHVSENAFGTLTSLNATNARGQGGGGNAAEADKMAASPASVEPGFGGGGSGMIVAPTYFKYVYKGEEFSVDADKMPVYERQKGFGSNIGLQNFLDRFAVGMFNIEKFADAQVAYLTASENRDFGYNLSIDMREGTVHIGENWERWQPMDYSQPIKIEQVPSDEAAVAMANQFLDEYGINRENFGAPVVQNHWRTLYREAADKSSMWVPDVMSVIYPIKIEGNEIYDQSGNKNGMYVSINLRSNRVSSVGEITSQIYNSSEYETEKDISKIQKIAENGGFMSYMPIAEDSNVKYQEVELGTPTKGYVRMWQTLDGKSRDMYIPSLIFPIKNQPNNFYQQSVTVPLIKQVLDQQKDSPPVKIMPM